LEAVAFVCLQKCKTPASIKISVVVLITSWSDFCQLIYQVGQKIDRLIVDENDDE
jgi:hypothetical protein